MKWFLLIAAAAMLLQVACIGRQPAQQGTWSRQDGYQARKTDQAGYSPAHPE